MSISIKKDSWHVKDVNGQYRGTAIFSSTLPSEAHQIVTESIEEINAVKATIPQDYTELVDEVSDLSNAIDQKAGKTVATTTEDGLMSASDKTKLDDVYEDYSSALVALGVI